MSSTAADNQEVYANQSVRISFTKSGMSFASGDEVIQIPPNLVQRCGLLLDIRDQEDSLHDDVQVEFSMANARSWLDCSRQWDAREPPEGCEALGQEEERLLKGMHYVTLIGALKVCFLMLQAIFCLRTRPCLPAWCSFSKQQHHLLAYTYSNRRPKTPPVLYETSAVYTFRG